MKRNSRKVLLLGAGDIGRRIIACITPEFAVTAVTSQAANRSPLKHLGATAIRADLDRSRALSRLPSDWQILIHCAPPPAFVPQPGWYAVRVTRTSIRTSSAPRVTSSHTCCPRLRYIVRGSRLAPTTSWPSRPRPSSLSQHSFAPWLAALLRNRVARIGVFAIAPLLMHVVVVKGT